MNERHGLGMRLMEWKLEHLKAAPIQLVFSTQGTDQRKARDALKLFWCLAPSFSPRPFCLHGFDYFWYGGGRPGRSSGTEGEGLGDLSVRRGKAREIL